MPPRCTPRCQQNISLVRRQSRSRTSLAADEIDGIGILISVARDAADDDREALAELCLTLQHEASSRLEQRPPQQCASCSTNVSSKPSSFGRRMIWFHHIKSLEKRKEIVATARASRLRGFCKPGFPGVIVAEGSEVECEVFVSALRGLRWQAMDVRWQQRLPAAPDNRLPDPFVELGESAMGEAASLCDAAGLLAIFRSAVLKLDGDDNNNDSALLDVTDAAVESEQKEECVIFIDHMNDAPGYKKQLRKWSEQLGLDGGRLLHATPAKPFVDTARAHPLRAPRQPRRD